MFLRWKQVQTVEIDHTHAFLPPARITAFRPLDFAENYLKNRPHLNCTAVLVYPHPNPMLGYFLSDINMAKIAAFIVNRENFNPLNTIFVYDHRRVMKTDYRQIIFEWRNYSPDNSKVIWTAHQILGRIKFRNSQLDDFCEADEQLFKLMLERQKKVFSSSSKLISALNRRLFLLLISGEPRGDFGTEDVCHLAVKIDRAAPGENYQPQLFALCGATGEWKREIGKGGELLRPLQQKYDLRYFFSLERDLCLECEQIGRLLSHRRQKFIKSFIQKFDNISG